MKRAKPSFFMPAEMPRMRRVEFSRVVAGAADAAGGGIELDAADVFESVAEIEGTDVAHEGRGEHLDVHGKSLTGVL